jgi:hypothetical protein
MPISTLDKSWLACALDAEGSIVIGEAYRKGCGCVYVPLIQISNTNTEWMARCDALVRRIAGGGCSNTSSMGKHKPIRRITVSSFPRVIAVLKALRPYLIIKRERADNLLAWYAYRALKRKQRKKHWNRYDAHDIEFIRAGRIIDTSKWRRKKLIDRRSRVS